MNGDAKSVRRLMLLKMKSVSSAKLKKVRKRRQFLIRNLRNRTSNKEKRTIKKE